MREGWNWKYPLSYMYPAYTQLDTKWSSPSICDARATGCPRFYLPAVLQTSLQCIWIRMPVLLSSNLSKWPTFLCQKGILKLWLNPGSSAPPFSSSRLAYTWPTSSRWNQPHPSHHQGDDDHHPHHRYGKRAVSTNIMMLIFPGHIENFKHLHYWLHVVANSSAESRSFARINHFFKLSLMFNTSSCPSWRTSGTLCWPTSTASRPAPSLPSTHSLMWPFRCCCPQIR